MLMELLCTLMLQLLRLLLPMLPLLFMLPLLTMLPLLLPMLQWLLLAIMLVQLVKYLISQCPSHTRENTEAPLSPRLSELLLLPWLTLPTVFMVPRLLSLTQSLMLWLTLLLMLLLDTSKKRCIYETIYFVIHREINIISIKK